MTKNYSNPLAMPLFSPCEDSPRRRNQYAQISIRINPIILLIVKSMPSRNAIKNTKQVVTTTSYNRGVAKQIVFETDKDYKTFLLSPVLPHSSSISEPARTVSQAQQIHTPSKQLKNYAGETLLAYCLMPNHFISCCDKIPIMEWIISCAHLSPNMFVILIVTTTG